jgi:hypothetical protein
MVLFSIWFDGDKQYKTETRYLESNQEMKDKNPYTLGERYSLLVGN